MLLDRHVFLALSLAIFPLGCTAADPEQVKSADEQSAGEQALSIPTVESLQLFSTWKGDNTGGQFSSIVLMTDGRYHYAKSVVCMKAPCNPVVSDGVYSLYKVDRSFFVVFREGTSREGERYEYAVEDTTLRIRPAVAGSQWQTMQQSPIAWCATTRECNVQNLATGPCAGAYACEQSACTWKCNPGEPEPSVVGNQGAKSAK